MHKYFYQEYVCYVSKGRQYVRLPPACFEGTTFVDRVVEAVCGCGEARYGCT
jgi:hypothetical protein